jgi:hypothetical protein
VPLASNASMGRPSDSNVNTRENPEGFISAPSREQLGASGCWWWPQIAILYAVAITAGQR